MKCTYLSIFLIFNYLINSLGRSGSAVGLSYIEPDVSERVDSEHSTKPRRLLRGFGAVRGATATGEGAGGGLGTCFLPLRGAVSGGGSGTGAGVWRRWSIARRRLGRAASW